MKNAFGAVVILMSIVACGGSSETGNTGPSVTTVVYTGVVSPAPITHANAESTVAALWGDSVTAPITMSVKRPSDRFSIPSAPRRDRLDAVTRQMVQSNYGLSENPRTTAIGVAVSENIKGSVSGTLTLSGETNDGGIGSLDYKWSDFNDGDGSTITGQGAITITGYDSTRNAITDALITLPVFRIVDSDSDVSFTGTISFTTDFALDTESISLNGVLEDHRSGEIFKYENLATISTYIDLDAAESWEIAYVIEGRLYIGSIGYVDVRTISRFECDGCHLRPPTAGEMFITGENNGTVRVRATYTEKARLDIDSDNDGAYEAVMLRYWSDISGPPAPNDPPVISSVTLSPNLPYTNTDITVNVTATDPDLDDLVYSYSWSVNDIKLDDEISTALSADHFVKNDVIRSTVSVSDGSLTVSEIESIVILDSPVVANAGNDQTIAFGTSTIIGGADSGDLDEADQLLVTYSWTNTAKPAGATVAFSDPAIAQPSVSMDKQGLYTFEIAVSGGANNVQDTVFINHKAMLFGGRQGFDIGATTEAVAIGDLNSDGRNDVIVTTSWGNDPESTYRIFVLYQNGTGDLETPLGYETGLNSLTGNITTVAISDFNGDELSDVAIPHDDGIGIYLQTGAAEISPISTIASNRGSPGNAYGVATGDFNSDGRSDVLSLRSVITPREVDTYMQNGNGNLTSPTSYPASHAGFVNVAVGDLNGDGKDDIALAGSGDSDSIAIFFQQPNGTMGPETYFDLGEINNTRAIAIDDLDGDGRDDLVLTKMMSLVIYYQDIHGNLGARQEISSFSGPLSSVAIADVTGDRKNDIVTAESTFNTISVFAQRDNGSWLEEQWYDAQFNSMNQGGLAIGDVNNDQNPDIVVVTNSGLIYVLYNTAQ